MKNITSNIGMFIVSVVMLDVAILSVGLLQIAQGQGGYWSPFWRAQAEFVINLLAK